MVTDNFVVVNNLAYYFNPHVRKLFNLKGGRESRQFSKGQTF